MLPAIRARTPEGDRCSDQHDEQHAGADDEVEDHERDERTSGRRARHDEA
jgi:hypothetical protein